jgi:rhodanese-related sulfurtransferase
VTSWDISGSFASLFVERASMPQAITLGYKALLKDAQTRVTNLTAAEAIARASEPDTVIVDVRDIREIERDGRIPGSFHAPRGMLEFWVDPESPYHKQIFAEDKTFIVHCGSGWRSLLAADTLQRMGIKPVLNLEGGIAAWRTAGGAIETLKDKT